MGRTLLALHGPLKSGKSTLARALQGYGFAYVNFTRDIKVRASAAINAATYSFRFTADLIEHDKERYRPFLIELARAIGVDEGLTVNEVLTDTLGPITDAWPDRVVFDNVRYAAQMDKLVPYGFRLVRLEVTPWTQEQRAMADGMTYHRLETLRADTTEQPLPYYSGELQINANQPREYVLEEVLERAGVTARVG